MDATGSMQTVINTVRATIGQIVSALREGSKEEVNKLQQKNRAAIPYTLSFEVACVCYRDFCDDVQFETLDFTEDVEAFTSFLSGIKAEGGGDIPEDVLGGFLHALYGLTKGKEVKGGDEGGEGGGGPGTGASPPLSWDERGEVTQRSVVLVGDAPGHGYYTVPRSYGMRDDHPNPMQAYWEIVFRTLEAKKISLFVGKINERCTAFHEMLQLLSTFNGKVRVIDISKGFDKVMMHLSTLHSHMSRSSYATATATTKTATTKAGSSGSSSSCSSSSSSSSSLRHSSVSSIGSCGSLSDDDSTDTSSFGSTLTTTTASSTPTPTTPTISGDGSPVDVEAGRLIAALIKRHKGAEAMTMTEFKKKFNEAMGRPPRTAEVTYFIEMEDA